jgi:membrane-bound lytic murein transglycosylase A
MTSRPALPLRSLTLSALGWSLSFAGALVAQTPAVSTGAAPMPAAADSDALGQPFVTKFARFQPVPFTALPGWNADELRESLDVFKRSCKVLSHKNAWSTSCADLAAADTSSDDAARHFFEAHFQVYQVMNPDATADGRITGYYEPQLEGHSSRDARFRFPVYAAPRDLYQLDARSLSGASRQWFRIEDNRLLAAAPATPGARDYALALGDDLPGMADKRYRVRVEGDRIVPYFNRQQIESQGIDAPVLAWVQDAYALYSMQVQGSGKIHLEDGRMVRVAYAEQNGQPFLPNASSSDTAMASSAIKTRGLRLGAASAADAAANAPSEDVSAIIAQLKHGEGNTPDSVTPAASMPTPSPVQRAAPPSTNEAAGNAQVQAIIAQLRHGGGTPSTHAARVPDNFAHVSSVPAPSSKAADPQVQAMIAQLLGKAPPSTGTGIGRARSDGTHIDSTHIGSSQISGSDAARLAADPRRDGAAKTVSARSGIGAGGAISGIGDPSYVFFRVIPDGPQGPLGALGVPLTAGRSLAVDPRTTPLGAPVFVTTAAPDGVGNIDRLMFAQDTGGAIRGSVRGDFFWGFGADAGSMAASMNANGRMWLLLPKGLTLGALNPKIRTRSLGSSAAAPDCVIPDDESCVEN